MLRTRNEGGFLMVELLMAMTVMLIALTALITVFSTGIITMRRANQETTASFLADGQIETYRAMTSRDIGVDLSAGTISALDSNYKNDSACANSGTGTNCSTNGVTSTETAPTGTTPDSCTTINSWYPNTLPCTPSRTVSSATTPASPDGRSYRVDTYIVQIPATASGTATRAFKQVTVVVRDSGNLGSYITRESSIFDCSTGITPSSSDC